MGWSIAALIAAGDRERNGAWTGGGDVIYEHLSVIFALNN